MILSNEGRENYSWAKIKNLLRSVLLMPPIGFISAELQSYLVRYPHKVSSKFPDAKTNKNPC